MAEFGQGELGGLQGETEHVDRSQVWDGRSLTLPGPQPADFDVGDAVCCVANGGTRPRTDFFDR
jgi:hypothetical protein